MIVVDIMITNLDNTFQHINYWDFICSAARSYNQNGTEMVCKKYSMNVVVDFWPIHGNAYMLTAELETLVYGLITNNNIRRTI